MSYLTTAPPRFPLRQRAVVRFACAVLFLSSLAPGVPPPPGAENALTIMPFQTATYVPDAQSADLLNRLAEFSTELLIWTDSPTDSVVAQFKAGNDVLIQHYHQWREPDATKAKIPLSEVKQTVSEAFQLLQSPRIIRMELGDEIVIEQSMPLDVMDSTEVSLPLIVHNPRETSVHWVLRQNAHHGETPAVLQEAEFAPGQTLGFFLQVPASVLQDSDSLMAEVDGQARVFTLAQRAWHSGELKVRILDENGEPTASRVYLIGADQKAYSPQGVMHRMVLGDRRQAAPGANYFHSTGSFALELPAGEAVIEVVKGMEYAPVRKVVPIKSGLSGEIEIQLARIADLKAAGWYSGDVHVHANLFAQDLIKPADVLAVGRAEDLNVLNILPCNDPRTTLISDLQFFTGGPDPVSDENHIVYYNEEMRNDLYGHVGFLNLKTFVEPAYFGFPHSPHPYDAPGNFPQVEAAKRQGAFVSYVHPGLPSEFPIDIALGLADTIDVMSQVDERNSLPMWYALLNCGFRCPASAGTDSFLNIPYHLVPGAGRVYVKVDGEFTYENWIASFKAGRTFVTNGPLLNFTFNGADPGAVFSVGPRPMPMTVAGMIDTIVPISAVEIVVNGEVVRTTAVDAGTRSLSVNEEIEIDRSAWVAVRTIAEGHRWVTNDRDVFAHTSPVYVEMAGRPMDSAEAARYYIEQIDLLIAKMEATGVFADHEQRDQIVKRFREGQKVYENMLSAGK